MMVLSRSFFSLFLLASASAVYAQSVCLPSPRLLTTMPMGGQAGSTVEVSITGESMEDVEELRFSHPGITATPKRDDAGNVVENQFVVNIAADCPPGVHEARTISRLGVSSSRVFNVGTLPEVTRTAANTTLDAAMLLAVCLLNTVGLLLSKFLGKAAEIGVRQALGAHKGALFVQHVIEAGFLGAIGGVLGLGVAALGLEGVKILLGGERVNNEWVHLDLTVTAVTIVLAVISTVVAGLYPIWRACNINPAIHLKTE